MEGIQEISFEDYRKAPGINGSMLDVIHQESPRHLKAMIDGVRPYSESKCLDFGKIFHSWVLEPETAMSQFYFRPDVYEDEKTGEVKPWNSNSKVCKQWILEHSDRAIVKREDIEHIKGMSESLQANAVFMEYMQDSKSEQSLFAVNAEGDQLKARLDRLKLSGNSLLDLKSAQSSKPEEFEKSVWDNLYFKKAAFYLDICNLLGLKKDVFIFAAVEKKPPYVCSMLRLSSQVIKAGRALYKHDLAILRDCMKTGNWPGYTKGVQTIELPSYAMKQLGLD